MLLFHAPSVPALAGIFTVVVQFPLVLLFTVHTYTLLLTFLNVCTVPFVTLKSHVAIPLISSLNVHVTVYVWSLLHAPLPLLVILTVGATVSIHATLTVTTFVLFSLSFIVITQLSVHVLLLLGVYVIISPFIAHVHFVAAVVTVALNAPFPQFHSAALLNVFQFHVRAVFHTLLLNVKSFAVGATSLTVHVAVWLVTFPKLSLTYAVYVPFDGCVVLVLNDLLAVVFHVLLSKLYGLAWALAHHTWATLVILKLHAVHSFTVLLLNVNVGPVLSIQLTVALQLLLFHTLS